MSKRPDVMDALREWFIFGAVLGAMLGGALVWAILAFAWHGGHAW